MTGRGKNAKDNHWEEIQGNNLYKWQVEEQELKSVRGGEDLGWGRRSGRKVIYC